MRNPLRLTVAALFFAYFAACAPVKFEKLPEPSCGTDGVACVNKCVDASCSQTVQSFAIEKTVGEAMVDVLIVNDNSGSMEVEHSKMGQKFPTFLSSLGSMDYRIAMTTTDISSAYSSTPVGVRNEPDANNGYGALQDGNLIDFGGGLKYLTRSTSNKEALFNNTVQRQETISCSGDYANCPSNDERGIYAANLVLDRTASEFIRPIGHLAVVVLSDEDERGVSHYKPNPTSSERELRQMYPLENYDLPETFINRFKAKYPGKTLSVHSIVMKPGDTGCYDAQSMPGRGIHGEYGYSYVKLSQLTGGTIGSICASDYGAQLTNIGSYIQDQVTTMPLACRPIGDKYEITFTPKPAQDIDVVADFGTLQIKIEDPLPPLTKIRLTYDCLKTN